MRAFSGAISCLVLCTASVVPASEARSPANALAPLRIIDDGISSSDQSGATASYTLVRQSTKKVIGLVILVDLFDENGKRQMYITHLSIPFFGEPNTQSGGPRHETVNIPVKDGEPVKYRLSLDYVVFDDQSTWGPDAGNSSGQLKGMLKGIRFERGRLKQLLLEEGPEALTADLKSSN